MTAYSPALTRAAEEADRDPRWHALSLVRRARDVLELRDRDIAVLRGLLSLVTASAWAEGQAIMVYASNKTLSERCDGTEERTLRRRLLRLCAVGLIRRSLSPNRKRYIIRDEAGAPLLSYGFDLSPLRQAVPELQLQAEAWELRQRRIRQLRALLRDRLWQLGGAEAIAEPEMARLLRNKVSPEDLEAVLNTLPRPEAETQVAVQTPQMSDSDSQNVRDIQSSYKEDKDKKAAPIELAELLERSPSAMEYAPSPIRNWRDLSCFTTLMAKAMALEDHLMQKAMQLIGTEGTSIAILGLLEAGASIRKPASYFRKILQQAENNQLNLTLMFTSLTRKARRPQRTVPEFA